MEYNKKLYDAVKKIVDKHDELTKLLENPNELSVSRMKDINIQLKQTAKVVEPFARYEMLINNINIAEDILATETDEEYLELAYATIFESKNDIPKLEQELKILLLPVDPNNDKNVIVEMRPGVGGDESCIFVADLFDTYKKFIENQG